MMPRTTDRARNDTDRVSVHPPNLLPALALAQIGRRVLPCWPRTEGRHKAKAPIGTLVPNGKDNASSDFAVITQWWRQVPDALIGLVIPDHLVVVDVDPRHGGSLASIGAGGGGELPTTRICWSGRGDGGCHLYFQAPDRELTSANLPAGVDLLKPGKNYAIAPPSLHPDTGEPYYWEPHPVAPLPPWLLEMLTPKPTPITQLSTWPRPTSVHPNRLAYWVRRVANAPAHDKVNGRNKTLFWIANTARRDGFLDQVEDQLRDAARASGLPDWRIEETLQSARRYTT